MSAEPRAATAISPRARGGRRRSGLLHMLRFRHEVPDRRERAPALVPSCRRHGERHDAAAGQGADPPLRRSESVRRAAGLAASHADRASRTRQWEGDPSKPGASLVHAVCEDRLLSTARLLQQWGPGSDASGLRSANSGRDRARSYGRRTCSPRCMTLCSRRPFKFFASPHSGHSTSCIVQR